MPLKHVGISQIWQNTRILNHGEHFSHSRDKCIKLFSTEFHKFRTTRERWGYTAVIVKLLSKQVKKYPHKISQFELLKLSNTRGIVHVNRMSEVRSALSKSDLRALIIAAVYCWSLKCNCFDAFPIPFTRSCVTVRQIASLYENIT